MVTYTLFIILSVLCIWYSKNIQDKYLIFITIMITSLSPPIRVLANIGGADYFLYYSIVEVVYIVSIIKFCTGDKTFLMLLSLGIISSLYNLYEYTHFHTYTPTYEYNQIINRLLYTSTLMIILSRVSITFSLFFITITECYLYIWQFFTYYLSTK